MENFEGKLKELLGLNKTVTQKVILCEVDKLVTDLRGKMGFVSMGMIDKLKRLGLFNYDSRKNSYYCEISAEQLQDPMSRLWR